jgi:hypothetical protein
LIFQIDDVTLWIVATRKPSGRGGARRGAGRKRIVQDPQRIAVDFERMDLEALRGLADRRETSIADLVRRAVSQYLRRTERD